MVGKTLKENKIPHILFKHYFTMILNLLFIICRLIVETVQG